MPCRPIHCPEELYEKVLRKCFNQSDYPKLVAADVSLGLTEFEQGFSEEMFLLLSFQRSGLLVMFFKLFSARVSPCGLQCFTKPTGLIFFSIRCKLIISSTRFIQSH